MQINNNPLNLTAVTTPASIDQAKIAGKVHHGHGGGDRVQISNLAAQLSGDPAKLEQLQAAVNAGTYQVSPTQIANSIINDALTGF